MAGKGGPIGNKYAVGNKGGGRLGFTYEREQLARLRKLADRGIALAEAILKGKVDTRQAKKYELLEKMFLKALDKLQPNKQDWTSGGEKLVIPTPIYVPPDNSDKEDISTKKQD